MIINYYKGNLSMEKIRELTKTGKNGTTAFHIIEACKQIGFNSKGREYLNYLKKFENSKIITSYKKMNEIFSPEVCSLIEFNEESSKIYRLINNYKDYKSPIILKEETNE